MAYALWVSKVNALYLQNGLEKSFDVRAGAKVFCSSIRFEDEIKSFVIFFVNYWKDERTCKQKGGGVNYG